MQCHQPSWACSDSRAGWQQLAMSAHRASQLRNRAIRSAHVGPKHTTEQGDRVHKPTMRLSLLAALDPMTLTANRYGVFCSSVTIVMTASFCSSEVGLAA